MFSNFMKAMLTELEATNNTMTSWLSCGTKLEANAWKHS